MTFGDGALERELLQLFDRQAELLLERMREAMPRGRRARAYAQRFGGGLGAFGVAPAAAAVERRRNPVRGGRRSMRLA